MTCVKTGCDVYWENYDGYARADLYQVGACWVIRWNSCSMQYGQPPAGSYRVRFWAGAAVWHRDDLGVTVVPDEYFDRLD